MDPEETPPPLDPVARADLFLNHAIWCAAFPLALAILLCAGWWWFRHLSFAFAGMLLLLFGLIAFAAGISWVRLAGKAARTAPGPPGEKFRIKRTAAIFLLFGNFPAAVACMLFAAVFSDSLVQIRNASGKTLNQVEIVDPIYGSPTTHFGDLQPGEVRRIPRIYGGDSGPILKAVLDGQPIEAQLDSFDSGPGRFETRILPDGRAEIRR
ncbi:MAG: hypothetical protein JWO82_874 [Akkermansiaceae bacterium]|nr:hypothetical protein [Akkermansiaceae bacterium]